MTTRLKRIVRKWYHTCAHNNRVTRIVFDLVQVYVSIQSSGKPIEHFLADDQFMYLSRYFTYIYIDIYIYITH